MPLHAQHRLVFGGFHRFNHAVGGTGTDAESGSRFLHGLMMERVDGYGISLEQIVQECIFFDCHRMRGIAAVQFLTVLDAGSFHLRMDVLIERPPESGVHGLYAAADTQDGDLSVGCQSGEQEFLTVSARIDAMQFLDRFFSEKQRIDVRSAGQQDTVQLFQCVDECIGIVITRNDERRAACFQDGLVIAFCQHAVPVLEVAGQTDNWSGLVSRKGTVYAVVVGLYIKCGDCFHKLHLLACSLSLSIGQR